MRPIAKIGWERTRAEAVADAKAKLETVKARHLGLGVRLSDEAECGVVRGHRELQGDGAPSC